MINFDTVKLNEHYISLKKLTGKTIEDIEIAVINDGGELQLIASAIIFNDNTRLTLQGEHDIVYLHDTKRNIFPSQDELMHLYNERE